MGVVAGHHAGPAGRTLRGRTEAVRHPGTVGRDPIDVWRVDVGPVTAEVLPEVVTVNQHYVRTTRRVGGRVGFDRHVPINRRDANK
ncbi:hypothetical protein BN903_128 [Halorubrum sp. AJ67]|nr:hypothetical protein BN903_128 [Halorubrum sp. AJ67]